MKTSFVRAVFAASLLCSTAIGAAVLSSGAAMADDKPAGKVSKAVAKPLSEAQKLMNSGDLQGSLAKVKEAQAVPDRTPFDDYEINQFLGFISIKLNDHPTADTAFEAMADSPALPDADKNNIVHNALLLSSEAKHYQKTIAYGQVLEAMNALNLETTQQIAIAYYNTGDQAHAQQYAQKAIDLAKAAGQQPDQSLLQIVMNAQVKQNNEAGAEQTLEQLVLTSGDPKALSQLIDVSVSTPGMNDLYFMDLLRLKFLAHAMSPDDYGQLGNAAYLQGYPEEAVTVLQQGGKGGTTLRKSMTDAATDQRGLAGAAASAAKARSGLEDIKLAEDYWGYGRFADAEVAARRAIGKGGIKDPAEGPLTLGMTLVAQGKYDEAIQTLGQVGGNQAARKTAHLWSVYAQVKKGAAAPAAAPAPAH
jgi:tetratricopeptide (TPR) repeat protein